jgi:hypothetical protein
VREIALIACALVACRRAPTPPPPPPRAPAGLYWGRWRDVPDGVRVQVWLHGVGGRLRGTWELPPWRGEVTGARDAAGRWRVVWREEAVVAGLRARERVVTLAVDARTGALGGDDVTLSPAGAPSPTLRPGVWLARWTGLPAGMAVETVLSRDPGGRWRAAYRYQEREGMFEGEGGRGGRARDPVARGVDRRARGRGAGNAPPVAARAARDLRRRERDGGDGVLGPRARGGAAMSVRLLRVLIEGGPAEVAAVLHEEVHFRQGDGTVHRGREAVLAMFGRSERGVRYEVTEAAHGTLRVVMSVPGVPTRFGFLLCGRADDERLVEVWVEA